MTSTMKATTEATTDTSTLLRILREGYGPGAWHGPDMRAALADLDARTAFRRPAPGRHNAAEIAVHHAFYLRSVAERLTGAAQPPFPFEGDDWFELDDEKKMKWPKIAKLVESLQEQLVSVVEGIGDGRIRSPKTPAERLELVLGITCHAAYHAGQIQLVKVLTQGAA